MEEHITHLTKVFERIERHNLRLNPQKCEFATEEISYLGHIVSPQGIKPDPDKTIAVDQFPRPKKLKQVRGFLGLTSYYRKFVLNYSKIAKPLTILLKKGQPFDWTDQCEMAFQELKQKLVQPPILMHFRPGLPIILYTDASNYALGVILSQIQDGKEVVISYNSKSLDERQSKYPTSDKECLAIVYAVQKLRPYLHGAEFKVKTDNCALCFLMKVKNPNGRLVRWSLLLQGFDFVIEHKNGYLHRNVDCLSRNPVEGPDPDLDDLDVLLLENFVITDEQKKDSWCSQIINEIETNKNKKYLSGYRIENGILYRVIYTANQEPKLLLCVPKTLRLQILQEIHNCVTAGHLGFLKTYTRIRERFYWNRIEKTVRNYVKNCKSCQERKPETGPPKGELQIIEYPSEPFMVVGVDIVGRLSITPRRNQYIICLVDFNTKYIEAAAIKNTRSETIADFIVNQVITRHGAICKVLTDRAPSFCSEFIEAVYKLTKSQHITTTPYHPQTNGLVERAIRSIRAMMSHYVNENFNNWDTTLNKLCFAYNTAVQSTTGESPFKLLYGREARLPLDVSFDLPKENKFGQKYKQSLEECRELVKYRVTDSQNRQKNQYDMRHFNVLFNRNDLVGLHTPKREVGKSSKMFRPFDGPYRIVRKQGPVNYVIQSIEHPRRKPKTVHIQRLKRWNIGPIEGIEEIQPKIHLNFDKKGKDISKSSKSASKSSGRTPTEESQRDGTEKSKLEDAPVAEASTNDDSVELTLPGTSRSSDVNDGDDHIASETQVKNEEFKTSKTKRTNFKPKQSKEKKKNVSSSNI
jgi:hypothetical protein